LAVNRVFKANTEIGCMPTGVPPRRSLIWLAGYRLLQAYFSRAKQREVTGSASIAKARLLEEGVLAGRRQGDSAMRDPA